MRSSVIIPTFMPGEYLWECLDSICNQTLKPSDYEVVLILNGPKEPYNSAIVSYINNHNFIKWIYIYTEIRGVSNARNLGLCRTTGEYITFIDDDDYVSSEYLERLLNAASKNIVSLCYPMAINEGNKNSIKPYHITSSYERLSKYGEVSVNRARSFFSGPVYKMIHKDIIGNNRYDVRFKNGEDSLFMFLISCNISEVRFTSREAVYYRRFRCDSASFAERSLKDHLYYNWIQIITYTRYYLRKPLHYSFLFYFSRCGGCIYDMLSSVFKYLSGKKI